MLKGLSDGIPKWLADAAGGPLINPESNPVT
jgi:hypothetical protein